MQSGKGSILKGLVISKFGDLGPEPISWYPDQFSNMMLTEIAVKAVSILAGEEGVPSPKFLSVIPLPKFHLASVIYVFKIPDPQARGGLLVGTTSILFDIKFMSVIYQTIDDLTRLISPIDSFITKPIVENEDITAIVKRFYDSIEEFINNRREEEITRYKIAEREEIKKYDAIYSFKVVVVGDPSVGKTTLVLRYVERAFRELYIPTIGVQVSLKKMELDNISVKFNLWDIAGQDLFSQVRDKFYDGSQAVIILYDITNPKTFEDVFQWHADVKRVLGEVPGFIIGNKLDLPRKISRFDGNELAKKLNLQFTETSAKNGVNIDFVFEQLAKSLIKKNK
ncbi:MAG: GTP-binding protein [Candidatus Helarchaeota archaeon]|nr:GTP-binding protein [Candidatus Helarchaeota archaeon]